MGRPTEVRVRVPASSANLGPGLRLPRPRARPLRRDRGLRRNRRRDRRGRRRGRRPGAPRRAHLVVRAMRRACGVQAKRRPACGCAAATRSRTPGAWAARRRPRSPVRWPRPRSPAATSSWSARRCCRSPPVWRATPTTRPRACWAGSSSRGRRSGITRTGSTLYGSTCTRPSLRSRSSREPSPQQHHTGAAARAGAAGRRGVHRKPHGALGAGLHRTPGAADPRYRRPPAPGLSTPGLPGIGRSGRRAAGAGRSCGHLGRGSDRARLHHGRRVPAVDPHGSRRCRCRSTPRESLSKSV